jgi:hypothetical protein
MSFKEMVKIGLPRPSLAPEGALYWTKLYSHILNKRDQKFTTIRMKKGQGYLKDMTIPIYLDKKSKSHKLFDAKITGIHQIKKIDINANLAKNDADMTPEELWRFFDFWYKRKYGGDPQLQVVVMRRVV